MENIDEIKTVAMFACIELSAEYTREEVEKFFPFALLAWDAGHAAFKHQSKLQKEKMKGFKL